MDLIHEPADLPPIGTRESDQLDFKVAAATIDQVEMAKDIAAFANALGGILLVGAMDRDHKLEAYRPVAAEEARTIEQKYAQAAAQRCEPRPIIRSSVIQYESGCVVAVNVEGYLPGPIGVIRKGKETGDGGRSKEESFMFPVRSGTDTIFLTPGSLAMVHLPEVRRAVIMLGRVPTGTSLWLRSSVETRRFSVQVVDLFPEDNTVVLRGQAQQSNTVDFSVPLTAFQATWRGTDKTWNASIVGRVFQATATTLAYTP